MLAECMKKLLGVSLLYSVAMQFIMPCVGTMVFRPITQWAQGSLGRLVHIVKQLKPIYHIETRVCHSDGRILKRDRMSSHGLAPR